MPGMPCCRSVSAVVPSTSDGNLLRRETLLDVLVTEADNKEVKRKLKEAAGDLETLWRRKAKLLLFVASGGFAVESYLKKKAVLAIQETSEGKQSVRQSGERKQKGRESGSSAGCTEPCTLRRSGGMAQRESLRTEAPGLYGVAAEGHPGHQQPAAQDESRVAVHPVLGKKNGG